ncbi:MAG: type II toxin-antitoxin system VapB family antitoxin [Candidatus Competibacteraceae bacterium]|nr:type II toxin-antitoxin system VapB family antitoxin [Candidatus Competibacteraceae bacterium]MBK8961625.1 type II toxin-antitoxin system VapB family antitoxin [Candidatus Competibacteraceae bacterium]
MRTNIVLNDDLVNEVMRLANVKTKRKAVDIALRRFIASQKQRRILELVGQDLLDPTYDHKAARAGDDPR